MLVVGWHPQVRVACNLVTLRVKGGAVRANELVRKGETGGVPRYAQIPERNEAPRLLPAGYEFNVVLQFSRASTADQKEQVLDTLRWWTSFGRVDPLTRRGLGANQAASNDCELKPIFCEEVRRRGGWLAIGSQAAGDLGMAWHRAVSGGRALGSAPTRVQGRESMKEPATTMLAGQGMLTQLRHHDATT